MVKIDVTKTEMVWPGKYNTSQGYDVKVRPPDIVLLNARHSQSERGDGRDRLDRRVGGDRGRDCIVGQEDKVRPEQAARSVKMSTCTKNKQKQSIIVQHVKSSEGIKQC